MDPEYRPSEFAKAGSDIVTSHADATNPPLELVEVIRKAGLIAGLVLNSYKPTISLFQKWMLSKRPIGPSLDETPPDCVVAPVQLSLVARSPAVRERTGASKLCQRLRTAV